MQHDMHFCDAPMRCIDAIKCCVCEFSSVSKCVGAIWMAKCLSGEGTAHHYDDITTNISIFRIGQKLVEMLLNIYVRFKKVNPTCNPITIRLNMVTTMDKVCGVVEVFMRGWQQLGVALPQIPKHCPGISTATIALCIVTLYVTLQCVHLLEFIALHCPEGWALVVLYCYVSSYNDIIALHI